MRFTLLIALLTGLTAQGQNQFSLKEAQDYALSNNPMAKLAQLDIDQANLKVREIKAIGLPQVNAEGTFQHFLDLPTSLVPAQFLGIVGAGEDDYVGVRFGTDYNVTGSIGVTQLLFDGSYLTGLKASKLYPIISEQQKEKTKQDILSSVEQSYYMVAIAKKNRNFLSNMSLANTKLKQYLLILEDKGMTDSSAIDQADLSIKKLTAQQRKAQLDLDLALRSLQLAMGMSFTEKIGIKDDLDALVTQIDLTTSTTYDVLTKFRSIL